jgi:hypothetical protein
MVLMILSGGALPTFLRRRVNGRAYRQAFPLTSTISQSGPSLLVGLATGTI